MVFLRSNEKLNIVYHFRVRGTGAEGVHIAGIVNGFRQLGHNVDFVSPTHADPTIKPELKKHLKSKRTLKTSVLNKLADILPEPFFELLEIAYNIIAIPKLWKTLSDNKKDFIYERYAFFNLAGAFVAKRKKLPLVIEVNELSGYKRIRGQYFVGLCSLAEKYILQQAKLVITVSNFLNEKASKKVDLDKTEVITIPNGVPLNWIKKDIPNEKVSFLKSKFNLQGKKIICFVGGLVYWHNFDILLKAMKEVQNSFPEAIIMLIGNGPLKKYIVQKAKELDLNSSSLTFVGELAHEKIPIYLKMANAAVIPETNDFRSPIKMFEYMGMGLPVVAPKKPAIETAISHEIDGLLFDPGNYLSLAQMLKTCLKDKKKMEGIGFNAQQKVLKNFTWEHHAEKILMKLKNYNII